MTSVIRKFDQHARFDIIQLHNTRLKSRLQDAAENPVRERLQLAVSTQPALTRQSDHVCCTSVIQSEEAAAMRMTAIELQSRK